MRSTFATHPWIVRAKDNDDRLLLEEKLVGARLTPL
jgi:hypothetical protein